MNGYTLGRRAALVGAALIAAVILAACTGTDSGSPGSPNSNGRTGPNTTFNAVDVMFLRMMIPHHQQAVEMANLAETKATDPQVKDLATQISAEQTSEIATMKRWLAAWGQPTTMPSGHGMSDMPDGMMPSGMPTMPGMMSSADMAKLKAATGKDFDKLFLQMMIIHHKGAIQMAQAEQTHGANPDAKALAGRIIKSQQAEITTMQKMLAQMSPRNTPAEVSLPAEQGPPFGRAAERSMRTAADFTRYHSKT